MKPLLISLCLLTTVFAEKPQDSVTVQSTLLRIPSLPASMTVADRGFKTVNAYLEGERQTVEQTLKALYARAASLPSLEGTTFRGPEANLARTLLLCIKDPHYTELEQHLLEARKAWAQDASSPKPTTEKATKPFKEKAREASAELEFRRKQFRQGQIQRQAVEDHDVTHGMKEFEDPEQQWLRISEERFFARPGGAPGSDPKARDTFAKGAQDALLFSPWSINPMTEGFLNQQAELVQQKRQDQEQNQIAKIHLEALGPLFDLLVLHLEGRFLELSAQPISMTSISPELQALRVQTSIALFERLRSCIWYAHCIWADLARKPLPQGLQGLNAKAS